ncbi:Protein angel 2, partial [Mortierella alpina]
LRVVTYNLLSNKLAQKDPKFQRDVHVPDPTVWAQRRALLLDEIQTIKADVVCVQELDEPEHEGDFGVAIRKQGYQSTFKKRTSNVLHGFAIVHRSGRTTLVRECPIPCPQRKTIRGMEDAGAMLVLDVAEGVKA